MILGASVTPRRRRALAVGAAALWQLLLATQQLFVGPVDTARCSLVTSRAVQPEVQAPTSSVLRPEEALEDARLLGTWRYKAGAYEIRRSAEGKVVFLERGLMGELRPSGEWLVAELPPEGRIQLKLAAEGSELFSNFRAENGVWGETITAIREWASLSAKARRLQSELSSLEFEGSAANGSVVVAVSGQQQPVAIRVLPDGPVDQTLGPLIMEAHSKAVGESLDTMTEMLRQVYASHFGGMATVPPKDSP